MSWLFVAAVWLGCGLIGWALPNWRKPSFWVGFAGLCLVQTGWFFRASGQ